jgi:hypothetical protein
MSVDGFAAGTRAYEEWLKGFIQLDPDELEEKRRRMAEDRFEFLRASFHRWAALWRDNAGRMGLDGVPEVLGVGDLHVENFGTWRDADGRLAWGVNDFDEACPLPYVNDLVRLAVSAELALESEKNADNFKPVVTEQGACASILKGYTRGISDALGLPDKDDLPDGLGMDEALEQLARMRVGLRDRRRPYVLAEEHGWLRTVATNKLEKKDKQGKTKFEKIVDELSGGELPPLRFAVPPAARGALAASFPPAARGRPEYRIGQRRAGLGSLGRQRFTAVADDWDGGLIAREAKALAPSAWLWANGLSGAAREVWYAAVLENAVRSRDPWVRVQDGWVIRRLAPDAGKVKLDDLPPELDDDLLCAMGQETANVHSPSREPLRAVYDDLRGRRQRDEDWFARAVERMKSATLADWEECKAAGA